MRKRPSRRRFRLWRVLRMFLPKMLRMWRRRLRKQSSKLKPKWSLRPSRPQLRRKTSVMNPFFDNHSKFIAFLHYNHSLQPKKKLIFSKHAPSLPPKTSTNFNLHPFPTSFLPPTHYSLPQQVPPSHSGSSCNNATPVSSKSLS